MAAAERRGEGGLHELAHERAAWLEDQLVGEDTRAILRSDHRALVAPTALHPADGALAEAPLLEDLDLHGPAIDGQEPEREHRAAEPVADDLIGRRVAVEAER